jgi:carbon monoxide dehydrogenase subunit G
MTVFESTVTINQPVNKVYDFLADLNNHGKLMPENVQDWQSTYNTASLSIQNMAKLSLQAESRVENSEIKIIALDKKPFDLALTWTLSSAGDDTEVNYTITADLNMMLKMLASGPLQKLADHETQSLATILS